MKIADKTMGILFLVVYCVLFIGLLAATVNSVLYKTVGVDDSISKWDISKVNDDEFTLSYIYPNKITQKEYIVERSIDGDQYDKIKDKSNFNIKYVGYFPGSPHIEGVDGNFPLLLFPVLLILLALVIRRNIFLLKGKLSAKEFF